MTPINGKLRAGNISFHWKRGSSENRFGGAVASPTSKLSFLLLSVLSTERSGDRLSAIWLGINGLRRFIFTALI